MACSSACLFAAFVSRFKSYVNRILFMSALFRSGCVGASIVNRKRADAQQGKSSESGGADVFHAKNFCASKPLNATQLIGDVL